MTLKDEEAIFEDMRKRLMRLTIEQLRKIAKDERIAMAHGASRMECADAIASARRHRIHEQQESETAHPWRRYGSVNAMPIWRSTYV